MMARRSGATDGLFPCTALSFAESIKNVVIDTGRDDFERAPQPVDSTRWTRIEPT